MFDIFSPFHPTWLLVPVPNAAICATLRPFGIVPQPHARSCSLGAVASNCFFILAALRGGRRTKKKTEKKYENDGYDYEQTLKGKYANRTISDIKL